MLSDIDKKLTGGVDASNDTFILMSSSVYMLEEVGVCFCDRLTLIHCGLVEF